jgi:hypothetical protein
MLKLGTASDPFKLKVGCKDVSIVITSDGSQKISTITPKILLKGDTP